MRSAGLSAGGAQQDLDEDMRTASRTAERMPACLQVQSAALALRSTAKPYTHIVSSMPATKGCLDSPRDMSASAFSLGL